ncbi:MAG: FimB/Mfa2 family fimbrial subunit [Prevotella sp.]|nr:FimB/Mfa2 family fimbrial subunit [Prevotella sp.]
MNVRLIIQKGFVAAVAALTLSSCDMMTEDLSDCPTGLYVNFVYDYNIQRADMFKDHVGGLTLYVYDESDRLVTQRTVSGSELQRYGFNIHFTEQELAPDHKYRLQAIALQKDWQTALGTPGAKYRKTEMTAGSNRSTLAVKLDRNDATPYHEVSASAPLDTLWHTLTTLQADNENFPAATKYHLRSDGTASTNGVETVTVVSGEPTYATVSLIRDTNHLNLSLREIDNPEQVNHEDYDVTIIDDNPDVDYENNVIAPNDTVVYRPYAQWTAVVESDGVTTADYSAHYDLMFNRLRYNTTTQKNAVLCIRKRATGEVVALFNLPYILCQGRMAYEINNYQPQEYLDREYDYRLELWLKNQRWQEGAYLAVCVHELAWAYRIQYVAL